MEVASSLGMPHNNIFYPGIHKHIGRNLSGIRSLIFKVQILRTDSNMGSFDLVRYSGNIDSRYTEHNIHAVRIGNRN